MKPITLQWLRITKTFPLVFLVVFIVLIAFLLFSARTQLKFEENMVSSLPESIKLELLKIISERQKSDQLLGIKCSGTPEEVVLAELFVDSCLSVSEFLDTTVRLEPDMTSALEPILSNTPRFMEKTATEKKTANKIEAEVIHVLRLFRHIFRHAIFRII